MAFFSSKGNISCQQVDGLHRLFPCLFSLNKFPLVRSSFFRFIMSLLSSSSSYKLGGWYGFAISFAIKILRCRSLSASFLFFSHSSCCFNLFFFCRFKMRSVTSFAFLCSPIGSPVNFLDSFNSLSTRIRMARSAASLRFSAYCLTSIALLLVERLRSFPQPPSLLTSLPVIFDVFHVFDCIIYDFTFL